MRGRGATGPSPAVRANAQAPAPRAARRPIGPPDVSHGPAGKLFGKAESPEQRVAYAELHGRLRELTTYLVERPHGEVRTPADAGSQPGRPGATAAAR